MTKKITDELELKIRDEFVHGVVGDDGVRRYPTIDLLTKKHDVARTRLYARSKENDWQSQKNKYQSEITEKLDKERMDRVILDSKKLDDTCIQLAMGMLNTVGMSLQKHLDRERSDPEYAGIPAHVINHLATTTASAQKIGKLALGEAQEISKVAADVSNPEAFRAIMEQLDQLASARAQSNDEPVH
jgi:hypothetical protein